MSSKELDFYQNMSINGSIMKKLLVLIITCFSLWCFAGIAMAAAANNAVFQLESTKYKINDQVMVMDAPPFIADNRTYVPLRFLAHALGVADQDIQWDKKTETATLTYHNDRTIKISMKINDKTLAVTNSPGDQDLQAQFIQKSTVAMDAAPVLKNDRCYLPARWVAEALGYTVEWDNPTQCVLVYGPAGEQPAPFPKINTRIIKSISDNFKLTAQLPQIAGLKDTNWQEQLNNQIMDKFDKAKADMAKNVQDYEDYVKNTGRPLIPLELYISYNQLTTGSLLALAVETYEFTGGAHGMAWKDYYNIDLRNDRVLALKDLFNDNADYKAIINEEIYRQINLSIKQGNSMYFEGDLGFKSIADNQNFYIDGDNLVICFGQYEIAPYAAGMPEIKLPLDLLKPSLNKDFLTLLE